jgi:hypothetical protein
VQFWWDSACPEDDGHISGHGAYFAPFITNFGYLPEIEFEMHVIDHALPSLIQVVYFQQFVAPQLATEFDSSFDSTLVATSIVVIVGDTRCGCTDEELFQPVDSNYPCDELCGHVIATALEPI